MSPAVESTVQIGMPRSGEHDEVSFKSLADLCTGS
jgi:hypothetical protein